MTAGNTALCTVGRTGNDLHYRGYDILDLATACEFEEVAYLLVHGKLPNTAELAGYKAKLKALRGLPANVKTALEAVPASAHPMDVMRTGVSILGTVLPEKDDHNLPGARDIADRLMASLGSMLLYWFHFAQNGRRIEVETDDDSIGGRAIDQGARRCQASTRECAPVIIFAIFAVRYCFSFPGEIAKICELPRRFCEVCEHKMPCPRPTSA